MSRGLRPGLYLARPLLGLLEAVVFWAACLYDKEQKVGWRKVFKGVHKKRGRIFVQIIHCGRVAHPSKTRSLEIWAPFALAVRESIREMSRASFPANKEMSLEEISHKIYFRAH